MTEEPVKRRFLPIKQAAEELNVKTSLIRGLIKTGELRAIQVGGRGSFGRPAGLRPVVPATTRQ